ncbi:MAG: LacI family transcriptional regulator [Actinomycetota bacterium]|nr:LacI family transcriptional regulator [Actinomycetota bacterium]
MSINLRDVAVSAGVSVKTVSNVVNEQPYVRPATRAKVQKAITALGYRPNLPARRLRTGRSGLIALALPEIDAPYFAELAGKIVRAAERRGWTVLIDMTGGERSHERRAAAGFRGDLVDGTIASPLSMTARDVASVSQDHPLVLLGEKLAHVGSSHVGVDSVDAAAEATRHLIDIGRRRIAAIGSTAESTGTAALRLRGYRKALVAAGRRPQAGLIRSGGGYHREDGFAAMNELLALRTPPDAVFCFNDLLALGAMRALHIAGRRIPEDVAVVGFDDITDGRYHTPSLSTIAPEKDVIAEAAVRLLAHRIDRPADGGAPEEVLASHRLIVRESSSV